MYSNLNTMSRLEIQIPSSGWDLDKKYPSELIISQLDAENLNGIIFWNVFPTLHAAMWEL